MEKPNMISQPTQKTCHPDRSGAPASGVEGPAFVRATQCLALFFLLALLALSTACNRGTSQPSATTSQSPAKRYPLKGKVISLDKPAGSANINNEPIPNFMDQMVMPYPIKPPAELDQLQPGDSITADVVVAEPGKYWLENIKITGHSKPPPAK
jgi:Cu/Ag efflux protein CusF